MPHVNKTDTELWWIIGILAAIFFLILLVGIARSLSNFSTELRHLNNEIQRTYGDEQKYWKRRKRKLWLSLIPFVKF